MTKVRVSGAARVLGHLALVLSLGACGLVQPEEDDNGTGDRANWAFTGTASKTNVTIQQGVTDTILITVTRSGGFTGPVQVVPAPTMGFTLSVGTPATSGTTTTTPLIVSIPASFGLLNAPFQFFANLVPSADGMHEVGLTFNLTVTPKPGLFVQAQSSVTIPASGAPVNFPFAIVRTQFPDDVSFSLINAPAGITATFSPNPLTGGATQSTMTIRTNGTVAAGTYTSLGLRANAGLPSQGTAPLTVIVTP
jgi:hypothetical protein